MATVNFLQNHKKARLVSENTLVVDGRIVVILKNIQSAFFKCHAFRTKHFKFNSLSIHTMRAAVIQFSTGKKFSTSVW